MKIPLPQNLRFLRHCWSLTQWQVALWLGVDRSAYTYYETGKTLPPLLSILKLAWLFEVSLDELILEDLIEVPPDYVWAFLHMPEEELPEKAISKVIPEEKSMETDSSAGVFAEGPPKIAKSL